MAIAASGEPNICLTLTMNTATGDNPAERYRLLHNGWKSLVKRILRQFKKPPEQRWILTTDEGYQYQEIKTHRITNNTPSGKIDALHYMAFAEETQAGEPHLHILLRTDFIPQRWISQQMAELIASPVCWIEKIKGAKAAIKYVTKYVTKAPAQFGNSRRYWYSRKYQVNTPNKAEQPIFDRNTAQLVNQAFAELIREIVVKGLVPLLITKKEVRLLPASAMASIYPDLSAEKSDARLAASWVWLHSWRQRCRI
jgi:hypothetical protein